MTSLCEIQPSTSFKARTRCSSNKNWFSRAEAYWGAMHTPLMLINNLQGWACCVCACVCVRVCVIPNHTFQSFESFNKCAQIHWFFIKLQMRKPAASNQRTRLYGSASMCVVEAWAACAHVQFLLPTGWSMWHKQWPCWGKKRVVLTGDWGPIRMQQSIMSEVVVWVRPDAMNGSRRDVTAWIAEQLFVSVSVNQTYATIWESFPNPA